MISEKEILDAFPAPKFRRYQRKTLVRIAEAFNSGMRVILLEAPTGFGKSIVNSALCSASAPSFYVTPQLNLMDQMSNDRYLKNLLTPIKGRQNYRCAFDPYATCDVGVCQRTSKFDCPKSVKCPYWRAKYAALEADTALMSFAYFILENYSEAPTGKFGNRQMLILDEAHDLDMQLLAHINIKVSPWTIPKVIYNKISNRIRDFRTVDELRAFIRVLTDIMKAHFLTYEQITLSGGELSIGDVKERNRVQNFVLIAEKFFSTTEAVEWVWQLGWTKYRNRKCKTLTAMPVFSRFFTPDLVWNRADYFVVSSATILDASIFAYENGMDRAFSPKDILYLKVPSTFPPENRPIIDATGGVGKLTRDFRDANLPKAVKVLESILDLEEGKNIAVHLRSYSMMEDVLKLINQKYRFRIIHHKSEDRKEAYKAWKNSEGKVFLCVSFEEGYDWVGDICRAQVLFKVPYLDTSDKRVARRLEMKKWKWYWLEAIRESIQAYGRAVRSETDWASMYVIDGAFPRLLRWTRRVLPGWYKDALPPEWKRLAEV